MADLYAERYTTATQVTLDGKRTLGSIVDEAITSREFDYLKTEGNLRRLNGISNEDSQLRTATTGSYRISQELVRYVIPIEATELRSGDTDYQRLLSRIRNTIRIAPLERVMTTAAGSQTSDDGQAETPIARDHDPLHPNDPQCLAARKAMADLLAAIKYTSTKGAGTVMVGVAEDDFDPGHRDLFDPSSKKSILYLVTDANELTAAPNSGVPDVAAGAEPVEWRDFETTDHGTAVAALIAGRSRPYDASGGLSSALIGMFTRTSDMTTLSQDIERALNQSNMSIVNLSLRNRGKAEAPTLRVLMEAKQRDALFVVSAPNTSSQVTLCSGQEKYYPACHGDEFENVLVVGGTTLNGDAIFAESPIGPSVHLFAPEAGYFSAGRRNAYVPVKGTSFATAIVSAAAALLRNAGVASPSLIRQRLIATADVINTPNRPQWARLLDIKRALSNVGQSVIVDANTSQESVVDVTNKSATLQFKTVSDNRTVPVTVGDLRRLRRVPGNPKQFDLAYVTPNGKNNEGLRNENLILLRVTAVGALRVCTLPNVGEDSCIDLAEYADYVGPIQ
jgi:subtilisin family serine protease